MKSFVFILLVFVSLGVDVQHNAEIDSSYFVITLEKNSKIVNLHCEQGCHWKTLSFKVNNDVPTLINNFGVLGNQNNIENEKENANFLFSITKTISGITLRGIKNTNWESLSFTLKSNIKQTFNESGMLAKK